MTIPLMGDVVRGLPEAEFRSDVQLSSYRRPENLELVRSYIFTSRAPQGKESSARLLRLLSEAYIPGGARNRFTVIANYGHGKSHFALMMANFFGRSEDSTEAELILDKLEHAVEDRADYGFFEGFKRNHRPFLVITLRGDEPGDLRSKFFRALEEARGEYPELSSIQLPFWFSGAERFLQNLSQDLRPKAESFLQSRSIDLPLLLERVRERDSTVYTVCRDLFKHLHHVSPDFGEDTSLREAVDWAAGNLCGEDKPVGALLVIFDEFSAFVRDYSRGGYHGPGTPLQDLLNGIENHRQKAAFVALAQHDPRAIAQGTLRGGAQDDGLDNVLKELNRLPDTERFFLSSPLELVLDAYLRQSSEVWDQLLEIRGFSGALLDASGTAFAAFGPRYATDLGWNLNQFGEAITKGCFPLHPMTTALLSTLELRSTAANPRTVLGFVLKQVDERLEEPTVVEGRPNWVWPVTLVDYFGDGLAEKPYQDYLDAVQQAGSVDVSDEQRVVLKAMLLQIAGQVSYRRAGYEKVVAHLTGLPEQTVSRVLRELGDSGVIRYDADQGFYTFWPAGRGARKVDELLGRKLRGQNLDARVLGKVNELLAEEGLLPSRPVNVPWGASQDWGTAQLLLHYDGFNPQSLIALATERLTWRLDYKRKPRGLVLWLLAENDDQVEAYRRSAADVLDRAFDDGRPPLLVVRPDAPHPRLSNLLLRYYGLSQFSTMDIRDVGQDQYEEMRGRTLEQLGETLQGLVQGGVYEAPQAFRAKVQTLPRNLDFVLPEVFLMAYHRGPREFFYQYALNQTKLKNSVAAVDQHLLENSLDAPKIFQGDPIAQQIVNIYLARKWKVVDADLHLQSPASDSPLFSAWGMLDEHFKRGEVSIAIREALLRLLNPPYGYDYNTLTLLFTAWYGFNRHDIEFSERGGRLSSPIEVAKDPKKGLKAPAPFLVALNDCFIKRRDRSKLAGEVEELIRRVDEKSFSRTGALNGLQKLEDFTRAEGEDPTVRMAESAAQKLRDALSLAAEYDQKAESIYRRAQGGREIAKLAALLGEIQKLPQASRVKPERPGPDVLRKEIEKRMSAMTEERCARLGRLPDVAEYSLRQSQLMGDREVLSKQGMASLVARVDGALADLERHKRDLDDRRSDAASLGVLDTIPTKGDLASLRRHLDYVGALDVRSESSQQRVQAKAAAIRSEIAALEGFLRRLPEGLDKLTRPQEARSLRGNILSRQMLFEGTSEQGEIAEALERCEALEDFLTQLAGLRASVPQSTEDTYRHADALRRLEEEHHSVLGPSQREALAQVEEELRTEAEKRAEQALAWLGSRERDLDQLRAADRNGETGWRLEGLISQLAQPQGFLPAEGQERFRKLRDEVQQLVDEDELLQVEIHFRRIADPRKQLECLERLQRLTRELERT